MDFIYQNSSHCCSTGNNLAQLHGDLCLTGFVVVQGQCIQDFSCVLRRVLHSVHSGALLGGDVVQKGVVDRAPQVKLIEEVGSGAHLGFLRVMSDDVFKGGQELIQVHEFCLPLDLSDDVFEFVINKDDFFTVLGLLEDLMSNGGCGWEVNRVSYVGDCSIHDVRERSGQSHRSLISNHEHLVRAPIILYHGLDFPHNGGVHTTAQPLIGGDGNQHGLLNCDWGFFLLHIRFALNDFVDGSNTK